MTARKQNWNHRHSENTPSTSRTFNIPSTVNCVSPLGPKLEDATVGEEEVLQRKEEGLAYDHIQRSQGLRNLCAPVQHTSARQPSIQRGSELPQRTQLGEPPRERSNPSKKPQNHCRKTHNI
jgi:hypothetical protein